MPGSKWCLLKWLVGRGQGSGVSHRVWEKALQYSFLLSFEWTPPTYPCRPRSGGRLWASIQVLVASCPENSEGVSITGFCGPSEFPQVRRASL